MPENDDQTPPLPDDPLVEVLRDLAHEISSLHRQQRIERYLDDQGFPNRNQRLMKELIESIDRLTAALSEQPLAKPFKGTRSSQRTDPNTTNRIAIVHYAVKIKSERKGEELDKLTCMLLDALPPDRRVMIPDSWHEDFGVTDWLEAYAHSECCRKRLRPMFSKDRRRIKK